MSINSTMTALADEVRELSGKTGKLTLGNMTDEVASGNETISDQTALIAQIAQALEGKASGGGGGDTGLPAGYRRVDYIQFTGEQLVDTGIIGTQDTQINASFTWESSTQRHLFGCTSSDNTASVTSYMNGSWRFGDKSQTKQVSSKNEKLPYSCLINKTTISLNSSVTAISGLNDFETVGTLLLGGARDADGTLPSAGITGKVFYFILWSGDEQVQKLVPVVSADGVYRFFDLVTKNFFDSITGTPLGGGNL